MRNSFLHRAGRIAVAAMLSLTPLAISAQEAEVPVISSIETDRILEHAGQTVTVTGRVARVGKSPEGAITFLNFSTERGGFVAVVFESDYGAFPDGLEVYMNKEVQLTGVVKPYKGTTPQIPIASPDQIKVVEVVAAP
ncbi:MAG: hypothetical protein ACOVMP_08165 [Chthoniobacterales bacterium]